MKKNKKEGKLNLKKIRISKLSNQRMIVGGRSPILLDDDGDDGGKTKTTQNNN